MDFLWNTRAFSASDEIEHAKRIEAGLIAQLYLETQANVNIATIDELRLVVEAGQRAWSEMYRAFLPLATKHAGQWSRRTNVSFDELFQEACVILGDCLRRWDYTRGVRFVTMAWKSINYHLAGVTMKLTGSALESAWMTRVKLQASRAKNQRLLACEDSSAQQIALDIGLSTDTVRRGLSLLESQPLNVGCEDVCEFTGVNLELVLRCLPGSDRQLLCRLYGIGTPQRSHAEIANEMGVSVSTVRRLEQGALARAREVLEMWVPWDTSQILSA